MRTNFDNITDDEIAEAIATLDHQRSYPETESDLIKIAYLSWWMDYWKSWLGPPLTYYSGEELHYDGHHRWRSVKYIARRRNFQIIAPLRFS